MEETAVQCAVVHSNCGRVRGIGSTMRSQGGESCLANSKSRWIAKRVVVEVVEEKL